MKKEKLEIIDLTDEGMGIARTKDGKVVFVPNTVPGDVVHCEIIPFRKNIWQAENLEVMEVASNRIQPPCPYFQNAQGERLCGGCQVQQVDYQTLLSIKEEQVRHKLSRIGNIDIERINLQPIIGMENPWHYRNHIQIKVNFDKETNTFQKGFFQDHSHDIVSHENCLIAHSVEEKIWQFALQFLEASGLQEDFQNNWQELIIRHGHHTDELMIAFLLKDEFFKQQNSDYLQEKFNDFFEKSKVDLQPLNLTSVWLLNQEKRKDDFCVFGNPYLTETLFDRTFRIMPRAFFQVNTIQAEKMFRQVKELVKTTLNKGNKKANLFDLYCGSGTIGLLLAEQFTEVKGVEIFADSIKTATQNAEINGIHNANFEVGKAELWLQNQEVKEEDLIIVDPPRKGLDKKLISTLQNTKAQNLIYISCNPATLSRDINLLSENWQVEFVQPFDLFPWSMHVECIALLQRMKL